MSGEFLSKREWLSCPTQIRKNLKKVFVRESDEKAHRLTLAGRQYSSPSLRTSQVNDLWLSGEPNAIILEFFPCH